MIYISLPDIRKQLVLRYILNSIDYRKRCAYLQQIIALGKKDDTWRKALLTFLDAPLRKIPRMAFSQN